MLAKCNNNLFGSGYMAPEYALDGLFSIKSDVFSFGVVLLEILSGKRNTGFYEFNQISSLLGYVCFLLCNFVPCMYVFVDLLTYPKFVWHVIRHGSYGQRIGWWI